MPKNVFQMSFSEALARREWLYSRLDQLNRGADTLHDCLEVERDPFYRLLAQTSLDHSHEEASLCLAAIEVACLRLAGHRITARPGECCCEICRQGLLQ